MKTDDPKLTAYALGELPPVESAEIEALLHDDTPLAAEIEATRNFAARLRRELHAEEGSPLSAEQRGAVLAAAAVVNVEAPTIVAAFPRRAVVLSAIAACLIVGLSITILFPAMRAEKEALRRSLAHGGVPISEFASVNVEMPASRAPTQIDLLIATPTAVEIQSSQFRPEAPISLANTSQPPQVPTQMSLGGAPFPAPRDKAISDDMLVTRMAVSANRGTGGATAPASTTSEAAAVLPTRTSGVARRAVRDGSSKPDASGVVTKSSSGSLTMSGGILSTGTITSAGRTLSMNEQSTLGGTGLSARFAEDEGLRREQRAPFDREGNTESYDAITDNAFLAVKDQPLSTLSIDVDTASYANVRRFLTSGVLPPKGAVRIEEMLNYFTYDYPQPAGDAPFSATMEVAACPWTPEHRLVRIGLKGRDFARSERPNANLVFLIDVSGSMNEPNKLPLVKESLRLLVDQLDDRDQVAIAVYAGASGTVLEPTRDKAQMRAALDRLQAGGSTNGAGGIQLAYELAARSFIKGGTNRVILATDGDFNVGITDQGALVELITKKAKSGVFLSVLGYGMGNLKDSTLEKLADKGNGNYGYIDTLAEAKKTLVQQMNGTLYTIAKDVKIQVEFNPAQASAYRLIGYENRLRAKEDFNDDKKDAGEIGAGHMVTALYEVVPVGGAMSAVLPLVDALKYTAESAAKPAAKPEAIVGGKLSGSAEMLTLKLRYKKPDGDISQKLEFPLTDRGETWEKSAQDFRWAAAVASFGMLLRDSPHKGGTTWDATLEMAREGKGDDSTGYRVECLALMERAKSIWAGVAR